MHFVLRINSIGWQTGILYLQVKTYVRRSGLFPTSVYLLSSKQNSAFCSIIGEQILVSFQSCFLTRTRLSTKQLHP